LIAEEQKRVSDSQPLPLAKRLFSWLNLLLGLVLLIWGVWYVVNEITLAELRHALALADPRYMVLALLVFLATLATKAARWQRQFTPRARRPGFAPSFWAMMLGQFMNTAVSFLRLGEIARVFALHQQTGISKLEGLGTLVLEKSLDLIMLVLTLVVLIPLSSCPILSPGKEWLWASWRCWPLACSIW
jgi:glycosyltransferase 2 family protein